MDVTDRSSGRPAAGRGLGLGLALAGLAAAALLLLLWAPPAAAGPAAAEGFRLVWDQAPSNAFTDLAWFHEGWILAFREGTSHSSMDGTLRVLASADGEAWEPVAGLAVPGADLRDPKLSITPRGALLLNAARRSGSPPQYTSVYWTSADGRTWSGPTAAGEPNVWLWRAAWHGSTAYSVGYRTAPPYFTALYAGNPEQGIDFTAAVSPLLSGGYVNETTLVFGRNGDALALTRRDPVAPYTTSLALLGRSAAPYTAWSWRETNLRLGGPDMLLLPGGEVVVGARVYTPTLHTGLLRLDPGRAALTEFYPLPSGGDTGYPGMVYREGKLWVSYYSSHAGKAGIYFGAVELPAPIGHTVFLPIAGR